MDNREEVYIVKCVQCEKQYQVPFRVTISANVDLFRGKILILDKDFRRCPFCEYEFGFNEPIHPHGWYYGTYPTDYYRLFKKNGSR